MIVCHCHVVTDRDLAGAVAAGGRTLGAVCRSTGAGQDCGTCIFAVKAYMCQHQEVERNLQEVEGAAS